MRDYREQKKPLYGFLTLLTASFLGLLLFRRRWTAAALVFLAAFAVSLAAVLLIRIRHWRHYGD